MLYFKRKLEIFVVGRYNC